jgi:hypothetical protein
VRVFSPRPARIRFPATKYRCLALLPGSADGGPVRNVAVRSPLRRPSTSTSRARSMEMSPLDRYCTALHEHALCLWRSSLHACLRMNPVSALFLWAHACAVVPSRPPVLSARGKTARTPDDRGNATKGAESRGGGACGHVGRIRRCAGTVPVRLPPASPCGLSNGHTPEGCQPHHTFGSLMIAHVANNTSAYDRVCLFERKEAVRGVSARRRFVCVWFPWRPCASADPSPSRASVLLPVVALHSYT